jgi:DNA-binding MarR family transcriptional regulator
MVATQLGQGVGLDDVARELFDILTHLGLTAPPLRRRPGDLKEIEFHTLSILQRRGTMIVGDIQRLLGVLPAQMSRIIRSLENRELPLIECSINPRDKRKIDVVLTPHGERTLVEYQGARVGRIIERLRSLSDEDQEELLRVLNKLHGLLDRPL